MGWVFFFFLFCVFFLFCHDYGLFSCINVAPACADAYRLVTNLISGHLPYIISVDLSFT